MALPTIERNWIFTRAGSGSTINQLISPQSDNYTQRLYVIWLIKDTLLNFSLGPWNVVQSGNFGGTWGNSDNWPDFATFIAGGTLSSVAWIVLENTFAGRTAQILIRLNYQDQSGYIYVSTGTLFPSSVGGVVPVVPSDALRLDAYYDRTSAVLNRLIKSTVNVGTYKLNVIQTWDVVQGVESLRFSLYGSNSRHLWGFWDKVKDVPTGGGIIWDYPEIGFWGPYDGSTAIDRQPTWSDMSNNPVTHIIHGMLPGTITKIGAYFTTETINYDYGKPIPFVNGGIPNDLSGTYHISKLGINGVQSPMLGKICNLVDFWIGSNIIAEASYYPSTAPQFYQIGNFIWPWDGSTVPETT